VLTQNLTAKQRLHQAELKARLISARNLRQFLAGEIGHLPCSGDIERECIIAEIERATTLLARR
jgi:hypothetical protein